MNRRDPRFSVIEKVIYDSYYQQQPDVVNDIRVLVREGYTPTDIENFVQATGEGRQFASHVYWVASYLLRQQVSQN